MNKTKNNDIFLKHLRGVEPIKRKNRITRDVKKNTHKITKTKVAKTEKQKKEPETEKGETTKERNTLFFENIKIKKMLKKKLKSIDRKIDLHGMGLLDAEEEFERIVVESFRQNKRCLLFITGKGLGYKKSKDDISRSPRLFYGKIRAAFFEWIKNPKLKKFVLAAEPASKNHGGDGAFYVYLRKNKN